MLQSVAACEVESLPASGALPSRRSDAELLGEGESKVGWRLLGPAAYYTNKGPKVTQKMECVFTYFNSRQEEENKQSRHAKRYLQSQNMYKGKFQKFHCPEPTAQYGGRRSTDLNLESPASLALGSGSANQEPPRRSDVSHARTAE